jgi:hypothetical protein
MNIKFRENFANGHVEVIVNDTKVYSHDEYRGAAQWAIDKYELSDDEMAVIFRDYKDDYDTQREEVL